jgi:OmpA-OmpF porin, OOP family
MKGINLVVLGIVMVVFLAGIPGTATFGEDQPESSETTYGRAETWEFSPFIGRVYFEGKQNLQDSTIYGGRLAYNFSKRIGIEGSYETSRSHVDDRTPGVRSKGQFRTPMDRVDLTFYHLDLVYNLAPGKRFSPFAVAGVGATHYNPKISNKDMGTYGYGVGAKYWLKRDVALRVDLRDQVVSEVFKNSFHNYSATFGLVFSFGGPEKAKAAPAAPEKEIVVVSEWEEPDVEERVREVAQTPGPEPKPKVIVLAFEDVHFAFDKSTLSNEAKAILERSIKILKANPNVRVRIAGYTSASGTEAYNQKLSERRAKSVEKYLIEKGLVAADRLSTIGYGEDHPAEYEAAPKDLYSKAARANMRVLFETILN